jgi:hypothetical protein
VLGRERGYYTAQEVNLAAFDPGRGGADSITKVASAIASSNGQARPDAPERRPCMLSTSKRKPHFCARDALDRSISPVDQHISTGYEACGAARKEQRRLRDLVGLAQAPQ